MTPVSPVEGSVSPVGSLEAEGHSPRRRVLRAGAGALLALGIGSAAWSVRAQPAPRRARLVLAGPPAAVSHPLIRMIDSGALRDVADTVEFKVWKDPDQLRVLALDGGADFLAMPSNVAANLHNRGVPLRLLNISTWGVLWMVSRTPGLRTLADFKGQEIVMPFRADMPDLVFQLLAARQGLDVRRDFRLRYVASPLDAMQLLVMRRADHALLAEPAASVALRKTRSFPIGLIAPELHRSVDLQQEWGRVMQRPPRIPQAGLCALGAVRHDAALVARVQRAYAEALQWCEDGPDACGRLVASRIDLLQAEGVADSVRIDNTRFVTAREARPELEFFFEQLRGKDPGLIGGRLPAEDFYGA